MDFAEYACEHLERIDAELLPSDEVDALMELEGLGRATLVNDRIVVLLASSLGIYAVEERLKERYALGVIVLRTGEGRYTLRLVDAFLPKNLEAVYRALNRTDPRPRVKGKNSNVWGGPTDIGGSPAAPEPASTAKRSSTPSPAYWAPRSPGGAAPGGAFLSIFRPSRCRLPPPFRPSRCRLPPPSTG